jgi:hypothetical protein
MATICCASSGVSGTRSRPLRSRNCSTSRLAWKLLECETFSSSTQLPLPIDDAGTGSKPRIRAAGSVRSRMRSGTKLKSWSGSV